MIKPKCACGRVLHYSNRAVQAEMDQINEKLGPTVKVIVGDKAWEVPRHYIALHGLMAYELPRMKFKEVPV